MVVWMLLGFDFILSLNLIDRRTTDWKGNVVASGEIWQNTQTNNASTQASKHYTTQLYVEYGIVLYCSV